MTLMVNLFLLNTNTASHGNLTMTTMKKNHDIIHKFKCITGNQWVEMILINLTPVPAKLNPFNLT